MSDQFTEAGHANNERQVARFIDEMGEYGKTRNPHGYIEDDIPRLVAEVRAEMRAERESASP